MSTAASSGIHIAFYRFVHIDDVPGLVNRLESLAQELLGTILVASEGVNGMLAGTEQQIADFLAAAAADPLATGAFAGITVKQTRFERAPFSRLKIKQKTEIVPLGIAEVDLPARVGDVQRADVPPAQWRTLIRRNDVVVLDNRNSFEFETGHFVGAIDPGVTNFRDFADFVTANAAQWRANGTKVAMYCTGGIRCEKSSPWMQDLGLEVYQLQGGILNYFAQMPDAEEDFVGECFVFDNRITLDTKLQDPGRQRWEIPG
ncbi:MAG TPA: rhodanese-like domain-containing protein [Marmoricola sp.]|nr:rhodanese-like domain-containing protein [Marmoricola sp.]HNI71623.1 rhodanese-like domain-containing protein [Marmoricola sp.]HNN48009.1 rhodanese-like domain-containing protein [Marmoricola sp.]HNO39681.1 rhodanese-like domain-containing protein [Marmoricola sp.]